MGKINLFSISRLQKSFGQIAKKNDYLYVDAGKQPIYTAEPFRSETYSIILLRKGKINLYADLKQLIVSAPAVITMAPNITRYFQRIEESPKMEILFFTDSFLLQTRLDIFFLHNFHFFEEHDLHVLNLTEDELSHISPVFDLIRSTLDRQHPHEAALMRSYMYMLIFEIDALHRVKSFTRTKSIEQDPIFIKFKNLLAREFLRHRSVSFYANSLNISPKYLSEIVKRQTGKTAGGYIDKAIILGAKVLLQKPALSVAQVSERLNFSDQSVFGRFFKTHEGMSPIEFRKAIK
jgi:AraC family transcriptional activator of pobA